jgi:hypothetical protein
MQAASASIRMKIFYDQANKPQKRTQQKLQCSNPNVLFLFTLVVERGRQLKKRPLVRAGQAFLDGRERCALRRRAEG